jgi:hypothetical protein
MKKLAIIPMIFAIFSTMFGNMALASSITEDLADCAEGVAIDTILKAKMAAKAAEFALEHGDCIPMVSSADPVLIGMTGGILGLQANQTLARDTDVCIDQIFSVAQRPIAGMIDTSMNTAGLSSILPSQSRTMLRDIAQGASNEALYSVPGMTVITGKLTCGCAVAETGFPVEVLKETVESGLKTINSCSAVVTKLLSGGYQLISSGAEAMLEKATEIYNTAANAIKSLGCGWLWSCPSKPLGPPFFCTGYSLVRAKGATVDGVRAQYDQLWEMINSSGPMLGSSSSSKAKLPPNPYHAAIDTCEGQFIEEQDRITREIAMADAAAKAEAEGSNYALAYAFSWWPKCLGDAICRDGIGGISNLFYADIKDPDIRAYFGANSPDPFRATVVGLNAKYRSNALIVVGAAKSRREAALRANPDAPIPDRLIAFGCNPYLGRDRQSICKDAIGMDQCKRYVSSGRWSFCVSSLAPTAYFSAGRSMATMLKAAGCVPLPAPAGRATGTAHQSVSRGTDAAAAINLSRAMVASLASVNQVQNYQCLSPIAWRTCRSFASGGSNVDCGPNRALSIRSVSLQPITPIANLENIGTIPGLMPKTAPSVPAGQIRPLMPRLRPAAPSNPATTPPATPAAPATTVPMLRRPVVKKEGG